MARKPSNGDATGETKRGRGRPKSVAAPASNGPSQQRTKEVLAEYTRLETEGARINQAKSTLLNGYEREGGSKKNLKRVHALMKLDPREAQAELEGLLRLSHGVGIVVRFQDDGQGTIMDYLDAETAPAKNTQGDRDLAAARAHSDGYNSGLTGAAPSDNPFSHQPGSEEFVEWHNGRDEGQRDRMAKRPELGSRVTAAAIFGDEDAIPPSREAQPPA